MLKKVVAVTLAVVMVLALCGTAMAAEKRVAVRGLAEAKQNRLYVWVDINTWHFVSTRAIPPEGESYDIFTHLRRLAPPDSNYYNHPEWWSWYHPYTGELLMDENVTVWYGRDLRPRGLPIQAFTQFDD